MVITLTDKDGRRLAHHSDATLAHPSKLFGPITFVTDVGKVPARLVVLVEDEALFVAT
jgi:hypothetical protein